MTSTSWTKTPSAVFALAAAVLWLGAAPAGASPEQEARQALRQTLDELLAVLKDPRVGSEQKLADLTVAAERRFAIERMSALVLGRENRRKLAPEQRAEFLQEFKRHILTTYASSLMRVSEEKVEVTSSRLERNGDVTVFSRVVGGSADGLELGYRMRSREGPWLILDVFIDGVSVARNFRSQVQEIVATQGVEELIRTLREKNRRAAAERAEEAAGG